MNDDLISRQSAIDCVFKRIDELRVSSEYRRKHVDIDVQGIARLIAELPAVQPKEKTGQWIDNTVAFYRECSECGALVTNRMEKIFLHLEGKKLNYCPNCGAKMEVD